MRYSMLKSIANSTEVRPSRLNAKSNIHIALVHVHGRPANKL
jgi:hypothetical protein